MSEHCPKCHTPRSGDSCPKCGVVFAKFDPALLEQGVNEEIRRLWDEVEADWEDRARHAVFVERSLIAGAAGWAAGRYRRRGADDPLARDQLARIAARSEQLLLLSASPRPRIRWSRMGLVIAFLLAAAVGFLATYLVAFRRLPWQ